MLLRSVRNVKGKENVINSVSSLGVKNRFYEYLISYAKQELLLYFFR